MKAYKHTQTGYVADVLLFIGILFVFITGYLYGMTIIKAIILGVLFTLLLIFGKLHIIITENKVVTYFNFKLFKKSIFYELVDSVEIIKTPIYNKWGICLLLQGKAYSVSGNKMIQFNYKNGRYFRIGTDNSMVLLREVLHFLNNFRDQN